MPKVINATEVRGSRRGRRPNLNQEIVKAMSKLAPGKALLFDADDGFINTTPDDTSERQKIRGALLTHWKHSVDDGSRDAKKDGGTDHASVIFSPEGWPQVQRAADEDASES